jgi:diamine N-acetyltransferase
MFHVEAATAADIPLIQLLVEQIWRPTYQPILTPQQIDYMVAMMYNKETLRKQFEDGDHFLLLYDDASAIGYASYGISENVYKLHKIYVHPDYQGKGVGRLFINDVIGRVKAAGGTSLELDVNRYNKAKLFYEKQGFTVYEEKDTDIGNGYFMNDYKMRKLL